MKITLKIKISILIPAKDHREIDSENLNENSQEGWSTSMMIYRGGRCLNKPACCR